MGSRGSDYDNNGVPKNLKAEDLFFVLYQNDDGHNYSIWELEDKDILKVGYDEDGNAYEIDKKGNPVARMKEDPADTLEQIGEGLTLKDAENDFDANAELAFNENQESGPDKWAWWDNGGKERTLYGL